MVDGVTGFFVDNQADAMRAVERVAALDGRCCRRVFEERFSVERMAEGYGAIYARLLDEVQVRPEQGTLLEIGRGRPLRSMFQQPMAFKDA